MDSVQENTGADCADTFSATTGKNIESFPPSPPSAEDEPGAEVLQLVERAATRLEKAEEHCEGIESRARALADRAVGLLKGAAERIETLEAECQMCNALMSEAIARALMAEDALKKWDERFAAIEAQMSVTEFRARSAEARASKSEDMLRRIQQAIRSQLVERQHSEKNLRAA